MSTSLTRFLPRHTPPLSVMLQDLGDPPTGTVAKALGVNLRTVYRWKAKDQAPRAVMLALFFATRWGRSQVHCQAESQATLYATYAASLRAELDRALAQLARLGQIGEFGSANDPAPGVLAGAPQAAPAAAEQPLAPIEKPQEPARLTRAN